MIRIRSPMLWLSVAAFAAVGALVLVLLLRNSGEPPMPRKEEQVEKQQPGFMDIVKNPEGWNKDFEESERALEQALRVSKTWDDQKVDQETRRFLFDVTNSDDARLEAQVLRSLESRVHPTLLACLRDNTLRNRLVTPTDSGVLPETPFNRLCDLLAENPPTDCVPLLASFLDDPSDGVRKEAALVIGCVGSEACIAPLRTSLADTDEYVRSYALIGLQRAADANRLNDECRRGLFGDLKSLIGAAKNVSEAVKLLLKFDEQLATEFLLSDRLLDPGFGSSHNVLRALNEKRVLVDRKRLLGMIQELNTKDTSYPGTYQLGEALRALGRHRVPEDRSTLEKYLTHKDDAVISGAAWGILASHDLDGYKDRVWDTIKNRGVGGLTEPQRHFYAVTILDGEVRNGGLSQYFFNSSGDEWRTAVAGLEAMGFKERLAILREALSKFGNSGPSTNREKRMSQLSKLISADEDTFEELDSRYYKSAEALEVLMMRYVLKHSEAFQ